MKSPQKEHTNGKLKIRFPPKLLYFLTKLLVNSKGVGLKKKKNKCIRYFLDLLEGHAFRRMEVVSFPGQYLKKTGLWELKASMM